MPIDGRVAKECQFCGKQFLKPYSESIWAKIKFCSQECASADRTISPEQRFFRHVSAPNENGCRLWLGALSDGRYGTFWAGHDAGFVKAHIFAWELHHGFRVPDGKNVLHQCDVPPCVEHGHLFTGSQQENIDDMRRKGRGQKGATHYNAKLSVKDVIEIRRSREAGVRIAERFGISQSSVSHIRHNKGWRSIPADVFSDLLIKDSN